MFVTDISMEVAKMRLSLESNSLPHKAGLKTLHGLPLFESVVRCQSYSGKRSPRHSPGEILQGLLLARQSSEHRKPTARHAALPAKPSLHLVACYRKEQWLESFRECPCGPDPSLTLSLTSCTQDNFKAVSRAIQQRVFSTGKVHHDNEKPV